MKTELSIKQKLILTVFTVCILYAAFDLEFWQFFLLLIFVYAAFLASGLISNKAFKKVRDNNEKI